MQNNATAKPTAATSPSTSRVTTEATTATNTTIATTNTSATTTKRVYLIRHGETDANAAGLMQGSGIDLPLSAKGREQAAALSTRFATVAVHVIVVSSLQRTSETAAPIASLHPNARIVQLADLVELSWGVHEGKPASSSIANLWKSWDNGDFSAKAEGGESPFEVERRAVPALYQVIRDSLPSETNFVVIVHGRLIRIMLASIINHDLSYMGTYPHANTCINVLDALKLQLQPESYHGNSDDKQYNELKRQFVESVTPIVNHSLLGLDDLSSSLPTTPNISDRPSGQLKLNLLSQVQGGIFEHPQDIIFRAVVLNDTAHLANL